MNTEEANFKEKCLKDFNDFSRTNVISYACIMALTNVIKRSQDTTIQGLLEQVKEAAEYLLNVSQFMPLKAACAIFKQVISRHVSSFPPEAKIEDLKVELGDKGENLATIALSSRDRVEHFASQIIKDGSTFLVHGYSKVIENILVEASKRGIRFSVLATEARPDNAGMDLRKRLEELEIPISMILDAAVGSMVPKVDYVLVGAEGVLENGGIINRVGTLSIAMAAKYFKKPFYVATESLKFIRSFLLTQNDVSELLPQKIKGFEHGMTDFTPPELITLLFTDLGIFTPSAVSDELIQFYSN